MKHHLCKIFDKLGVSTRLELALSAVGPDDAEEPGVAVQKPKSPNLNSGSAAASLDELFG